MKLTEGMKVCISVKALQNMENDLLYGLIVPDYYNNTNYYDLYNEGGELACMDGEEVLIDQIGKTLVTFRNDNGDGNIYFSLTHKEAGLAIFQN
ncbi:MAG: hypothetical protein PUF72_05470 [Clostridiales bacterium]|nr:hypothetical protein [Clostridiales bacterium]